MNKVQEQLLQAIDECDPDKRYAFHLKTVIEKPNCRDDAVLRWLRGLESDRFIEVIENCATLSTSNYRQRSRIFWGLTGRGRKALEYIRM